MSYNEKHNEANGEDNRDGESHNRSWNCGVEGPTDDPEVLALRARAQRNFLATLLLSQGVPMILHGDELGRTQDGNNNTYAQDSEISWVHWDQRRPAAGRVHRGRSPGCASAHPTFRRKRFFTGKHGARRRGRAAQRHRLAHPDGRPMEDGDWDGRRRKAIGMYLNGDGIAGLDARGQRDRRRPLPALLQRRTTTLEVVAPAGGVRRRVGRGDRHRRRRRPATADARARRRRSTLREPELSCSGARRADGEPDHSVAASLGRLRTADASHGDGQEDVTR